MVDLVWLERIGDFVEDVHHGEAAACLFARLRERPPHADVRLDTRQQLSHAERFGDEVGRAQSKRAHRRFFRRHGRDHEHRQVLIALFLLQALEQLQAVDLRHHDVEQQQRGLDLLQLGKQAVAARTDGHLVPVLLEDPGQRPDQRFIVVGNQNPVIQS